MSSFRNMPQNVFPADAGMNRFINSWGYIAMSVPRGRGDEPNVQTGQIANGVCSPRTRG